MHKPTQGYSAATVTRGLVFIISAPAGTGKTTLVDRLCREYTRVSRCITCTTRAPRAGEICGVAYRFFTLEQFEELENQGAFLESARIFGNRYGILRSDVDCLLEQGLHVVLVVDTQGMPALRTALEAITIFLAPPDADTLERRLRQRGSESEEQRELRLEWSRHEMQQAQAYDYLVCNDQLDRAVDVVRSIIVAEEHRQKRADEAAMS